MRSPPSNANVLTVFSSALQIPSHFFQSVVGGSFPVSLSRSCFYRASVILMRAPA